MNEGVKAHREKYTISFFFYMWRKKIAEQN